MLTISLVVAAAHLVSTGRGAILASTAVTSATSALISLVHAPAATIALTLLMARIVSALMDTEKLAVSSALLTMISVDAPVVNTET